jgi:hypothetical protein
MTRPSVDRYHPSIGSHLDDLLASRFLPRRWAHRLWRASELPDRLQSCVRHLAPEFEWRAYSDEDLILFAIGRRHAPADQGSTASLDVFFLDDEARVYSAGVWEHDHEHGWWLDRLLELSYDCEHGWWLAGLVDPHVLPAAAVAETARTASLQLRGVTLGSNARALPSPRPRPEPRARKARS